MKITIDTNEPLSELDIKLLNLISPTRQARYASTKRKQNVNNASTSLQNTPESSLVPTNSTQDSETLPGRVVKDAPKAKAKAKAKTATSMQGPPKAKANGIPKGAMLLPDGSGYVTTGLQRALLPEYPRLTLEVLDEVLGYDAPRDEAALRALLKETAEDFGITLDELVRDSLDEYARGESR